MTIHCSVTPGVGSKAVQRGAGNVTVGEMTSGMSYECWVVAQNAVGCTFSTAVVTVPSSLLLSCIGITVKWDLDGNIYMIMGHKQGNYDANNILGCYCLQSTFE